MLEVYADWVMSIKWHELFGKLTYQGSRVHGFNATSAGAPLDGYGRADLPGHAATRGSGAAGSGRTPSSRPEPARALLLQLRAARPLRGLPARPAAPAGNGERYRAHGRRPGRHAVRHGDGERPAGLLGDERPARAPSRRPLNPLKAAALRRQVLRQLAPPILIRTRKGRLSRPFL